MIADHEPRSTHFATEALDRHQVEQAGPGVAREVITLT
jgi:hypothetical protein